MKPPVFVSLSASLFVGVAVFASIPVPAGAQSGDVKFACGTSQGSPATVVQTSRGKITVIRWVSKNAFGEDYSPEYRCRIVSGKFQQYFQSGQLNFLKTGVANGQSVICAAKTKDGPCSGVLFTLKPGSDPLDTLSRLMKVRVQAGTPLNESTGSSIGADNGYVDMANFLRTTPTDDPEAVSSPSVW